MNKRLAIAGIGILLLMTVSFLAGAWLNYRPTRGGTADAREIRHYIDPMHPAYTSDKPGLAPDCGMQLEPVYADGGHGGTTAPSGMSLPPGAIQVTPERQQLIGVKTAAAEKSGGSQTIRLQGRVVPDELRTYVINATIDGWITGVGANTTGSIVRKNEVLATFYSSEFLSAGQALLYALTSMERSKGQSAASQAERDQMQQFNLSLKQYRDSLRNLGMGNRQIDEMIRTRTYMENVEITAPGNGLVTVRNVSPGQRFERGKELYRIADLSSVWILVDTYGAEVDFFKPGMQVKVALPSRSRAFIGRVAAVPPLFDPASRTLKVRVEVENPGYLLRPEMFVDIELPIRLPAMLSVPSEALLDSGLKKILFVEKGPGMFEPREVKSGRCFGNRVEIVAGLNEGERIVISGTFLLDSESRVKTAAAGIFSTPRLDPVCGMYVDEAKAQATGLAAGSGEDTRYFCSPDCKQTFLKQAAAMPGKRSHPAAASPPAAAAPSITRDMGHKHD